MDTVVKDGFSQGYNAMALGGGNDLFSERLWVWRGRDQAVDAALPWPALVAGNRTSTPNPILVTASYVRPFVYRGHTYAAKYDIDLGPAYDAPKKPPYHPVAETMAIVDFPPGNIEYRGAAPPLWHERVLCQFTMTQVQK